MNDRKVCLLTAHTLELDWKELGSVSIPTMQEYTDRHGLNLKVLTDGFVRERAFQWSKIRFIRDLLFDYSWIWWIDTDAAITNQRKTIDKFLALDADVVIGEDLNRELLCNTGSFFVRNCPFSFWLLDEIWKREDLANKALHEQESLADLYRVGRCQGRVRLVPLRELNGYCDWHAERYNKIPDENMQWHVGDFVAHCAGYAMEHRIEILKEVIALTVR